MGSLHISGMRIGTMNRLVTPSLYLAAPQSDGGGPMESRPGERSLAPSLHPMAQHYPQVRIDAFHFVLVP